MAETVQKTAFVFAGGGSLGAIQVGMLRALVDSGIHCECAVGASAGAINAVYFACDPTIHGIERLTRIWTGLKRHEVFPVRPLVGIMGLFSRRNYLIETDGLRRLMENHLTVRNIEETAIPCSIVATEFSGGREVSLSTGPIIDALLASTAMPALFAPVSIQGAVLVPRPFNFCRSSCAASLV